MKTKILMALLLGLTCGGLYAAVDVSAVVLIDGTCYSKERATGIPNLPPDPPADPSDPSPEPEPVDGGGSGSGHVAPGGGGTGSASTGAATGTVESPFTGGSATGASTGSAVGGSGESSSGSSSSGASSGDNSGGGASSGSNPGGGVGGDGAGYWSPWTYVSSGGSSPNCFQIEETTWTPGTLYPSPATQTRQVEVYCIDCTVDELLRGKPKDPNYSKSTDDLPPPS